MDIDINELEKLISVSLNVWIKNKTTSLKDCVLYVLNDYHIYNERKNNITNLLNETINDWCINVSTTGLRVSYKKQNIPDQYKLVKLDDIYNITFIESQQKNIF